LATLWEKTSADDWIADYVLVCDQKRNHGASDWVIPTRHSHVLVEAVSQHGTEQRFVVCIHQPEEKTYKLISL
jgi:hypothetical protein